MGFRNPLTSLPFSAITGQIDPATQVAPGIFPGGVVAKTVKTGTAGKRIEMSSANADLLRFFTGDAGEQLPGQLRVSTGAGVGAAATGLLSMFAPLLYSGPEGITQLVMQSKSHDGTQRSSLGLYSDQLLLVPNDYAGGSTASVTLAADQLDLSAGDGSVNLVGSDGKLNGVSLLRPNDVNTGWKLTVGSFTITFVAGVASAAVPFTNPFTTGTTPIVVAVCAPITGNTSVTLNVSSANASQFAYRAQQQATGTVYNGTVTGYFIAIGK